MCKAQKPDLLATSLFVFQGHCIYCQLNKKALQLLPTKGFRLFTVEDNILLILSLLPTGEI